MPDRAVPLDNTIDPLTPMLNAFAVCNVIEPVEDDTPPPLDTVTLPPVSLVEVVEPDDTYTEPLVIEAPPTIREIPPAAPDVA